MSAVFPVDWLLRTIFALFLSLPPAPPAGDGAPALDWHPHALGSIECDVTELRELVRETPELAKLVFGDNTPAEAYGEAIETITENFEIDPAAVRTALAGTRSFRLWLLGFADNEAPRFVLVVDRSGAPPALPGVLPPAFRSRHLEYAGRTLYALGPDVEEAVWATEAAGRLAIGSDLMAAQAFLLAAAGDAPAGGPVEAPPDWAVLHLEMSGEAILNNVLSAMDWDDRGEFSAIGSFFDLPAWRSLAFHLGADRLWGAARLRPGSPLAAAVEGADEPPTLLAAIPADSHLAVALAVRDPSRLWAMIRSGLELVALTHGDPDERDEFIREFRSETGLDIEKDIVANLAAAALVIPRLGPGVDLDRSWGLLLQAKDATRAATAARILVARLGEADNMTPDVQDGVQIWRLDDLTLALRGSLALVGPAQYGDRQPLAGIIRQLGAAPSPLATDLPKRYPKATSFAVVDLSRLVPGYARGPIAAGLWFADGQLHLHSTAGGTALAPAIFRRAAAVAVDGRTRSIRAASMNNLRQISVAVMMYAVDHNDRLPPDLGSIVKDYLGGTVMVHPATAQPYVYNAGLAGRALGELSGHQTVLAHDPVGSAQDGGCVVYADGSVAWLEAEPFAKAVAGMATEGGP